MQTLHDARRKAPFGSHRRQVGVWLLADQFTCRQVFLKRAVSEVEPFRLRRGEQTGLPAEMVDHSRSERRAPGLIEHRQQFLDVKMRAVLAGRALFVDAAGQRFHDAPQLGGRQRQPFGHGVSRQPAARPAREQQIDGTAVEFGPRLRQLPPAFRGQPQARQQREEEWVGVKTPLDAFVFELQLHGLDKSVRLAPALGPEHSRKKLLRQFGEPVQRKRAQFSHAKPSERPFAAAVGVRAAGNDDAQLRVAPRQRPDQALHLLASRLAVALRDFVQPIQQQDRPAGVTQAAQFTTQPAQFGAGDLGGDVIPEMLHFGQARRVVFIGRQRREGGGHQIAQFDVDRRIGWLQQPVAQGGEAGLDGRAGIARTPAHLSRLAERQVAQKAALAAARLAQQHKAALHAGRVVRFHSPRVFAVVHRLTGAAPQIHFALNFGDGKLQFGLAYAERRPGAHMRGLLLLGRRAFRCFQRRAFCDPFAFNVRPPVDNLPALRLQRQAKVHRQRHVDIKQGNLLRVAVVPLQNVGQRDVGPRLGEPQL